MRRGALASLVVILVVLSAGCLDDTGPLHPPSGPADEGAPQPTPEPGDGGDGGVGDGRSSPVSTQSDVSVVNHTFQGSALGDVILNLTVRNDGNEPRRVLLAGEIEFNGSTRRAFRQTVVGAGETRTLQVVFDVPWREFSGNLSEARVVWARPVSTASG
ncbi:MAG: hypothetical protein V5A43_02200 [Haloarculaceae archaeon]